MTSLLATALALTLSRPLVKSSEPLRVDAIAIWSHDTATPNLYDIYYSIYDETANQWWSLGPAPASPITNIPRDDFWPAISFDHLGRAMAVWSHDTATLNGFDIYYSQWLGPAIGWTTPAPVASLLGEDIDPTIALWWNGTGVAVWIHEGATTYELWFSLWNGINWSTPTPLQTPWNPDLNTMFKQPEIAYDAKQNAIVVWTDKDGVVMHSVLFFDTTAWTTPTEIPNQRPYLLGAATESRKGISPDRFGNAIVVWNQKAFPPLWDNHYAVWNGTTFSPAKAIYPDMGPGISNGLGTAIAFDLANNATAVHGTSLSYGDIWSNRQVGGAWQPTQLVTPSGWDYPGLEPRIAHLYSGVAVTVWTGLGPLGDSDIIYRIWNSTSGTWTNGGPIVPLGLTGDDALQYGPVAIAATTGSPTSPMFIHDIAVTNVKLEKTVVGQGFKCKIHVTVKNKGDLGETFDVTVYANVTSITSQTITLTSGNSTTLTILWNTTGVAKGNYTITAEATQLPGETDTTDNTLSDGWIIVAMIGDITGGTLNLMDFIPDGKVDMKDIGVIARYFGQTVPPAPPNCDLTGPTTGLPDGKIDMRDIGVVARNFGKTDP